MHSHPRPAVFALAMLCVVLGRPCPRIARAQDENRPPTSLYDPRLGELRRTSVRWDSRLGPRRIVLDQVALVPDVPAFFEAVAAWDETTWFPILIDDADLAPKFLRAFRPARVVRYPGRPGAIPPAEMWEAAVRAVGGAWRRDDAAGPEKRARGDAVPSELGPTPPGLVVTAPTSPSLAGAVALAAGRFQPLLRWEPPSKMGDRLGEEEARRLTLDLETRLAEVTPQYAIMGDACDFLTLAAEYPDRYRASGPGLRAGTASFDDLVGRDRETLRRWAYTGRLTGSPAESVYRAMCSLFLQPESALLFDSYDEADPDFRPYTMKSTATRLPRGLPVTVVSGAKADLDGWHRAMGALNRFGLVLMNSTGGTPFAFSLAGGRTGVVAEIPPSAPSVVIVIHSFSAGEPNNARSIAGAWLSGGAYIYFGSVSEPYLTSFRTPSLVASLLSEGLPIAAAVRLGTDEDRLFGGPWRLHLLGDPLYRIDPRAAKTPRRPAPDGPEHWPPYVDAPAPAGAATSDGDRLAWTAKATIMAAARNQPADDRPEFATTLAAIRRDALPANLRPILDDLLIDALPRTRAHRDALLSALAAIPETERTVKVKRAVEAGQLDLLTSAADRKDFPLAVRAWGALVGSDCPIETKQEVTRRVGQLAEKTVHVTAWKASLKEAIHNREGTPDSRFLNDEYERVDKLGGKTFGRSIRRS